jgi:hypothetical protein
MRNAQADREQQTRINTGTCFIVGSCIVLEGQLFSATAASAARQMDVRNIPDAMRSALHSSRFESQMGVATSTAKGVEDRLNGRLDQRAQLPEAHAARRHEFHR